METKLLTDAVILDNVITALKLTRNAFASELGYKSSMTVYNIIAGTFQIPLSMIDKIQITFPQVSIVYLKTGLGKPIKENVLTKQEKENPIFIMNDRLKKIEEANYRIEKLLHQVINEKL